MDTTNGLEICRLCFEYSKDVIEVYGSQGKKLFISDVLSKHFSYDQICDQDDYSKCICVDCWTTVETFHCFYVRVESAYIQFLAKLGEPISSDKCEDVGNVEVFEFPAIDIVSTIKSELLLDPSISNKSAGDEIEETGESEDQKTTKTPDSGMNDDDGCMDKNETCSDDNSSDISAASEKITKRQMSKTVKRRRTRNYLTLTVRPTQINTEDYKKIHQYFDMTCDYCTFVFKTIEEARLHYRKEHTINGYLKCCNQQFKYPKDIFNHVEWHGNPLINQCEICHKVFKTAKAKTHHVLVHADEKNFSCTFCFKQFARKFLLDNHLKYYCTETRHERKKKSDSKTDGAIVDGTVQVKKKRLMTSDLISKIDKNLTNLKDKQKKEPQKFICDLCGRIYTAKTSLEYHQMNHHQDAEKQKVQCNICAGWYVTKYIKRHISQHNDTAVECTVCQKIFKNQKNLKAHMKNSHLVSESERRLACNVCEKRFLYPFHLKQHMISHTGGSLYKCSNCSKEFARGRLYRIHKKTCCIMEPISCHSTEVI